MALGLERRGKIKKRRFQEMFPKRIMFCSLSLSISISISIYLSKYIEI